jgi:multidrug resistance efflux pump
VLSGLLAIVARGLHLQSEATAGVTARVVRFVRGRLSRWLGPRGYRARTALVVASSVALFLAFAQGDYRLGAEAQVEAAFQRVLSAPWNGYLAQASARPGDEVRAGQVLMRLDDREQTLERIRWVTEVEKLRRKLDQATAARDRAAIMVASAQLRQSEAQLALVDSQLARIEVAAPFDGLIVSGDPTQRLGDVLKKGEVIYHIAPLNAYRLMIRVPETRIADLRPGMEGAMQLGALPGLALRLRVDRIHPFTQRRDGQSFFIAEATIEGDLDQVRPGMEGVATIAIDRRNLFGIWTRGLVDRLRVVWWSLFG